MTQAAYGSLVLKASARGLMTLGMQGFDYEKTSADMGIPDSFDVIIMIVVEKRNQEKEPLGSIIILSKKKNEK